MARNPVRNKRGTAIVEMAIVLPLLLIVLFAIAEFGIALYDKAVLTNASREGARAGIVQQDPRVTNDEIRQVVRDYAASHLITFGTDVLLADDVDIPITRTGDTFGSDLTVSVNYRYDFLILSRLVSALMGSITLNATTVMKME